MCRTFAKEGSDYWSLDICELWVSVVDVVQVNTTTIHAAGRTQTVSAIQQEQSFNPRSDLISTSCYTESKQTQARQSDAQLSLK